MSKYSEVFIFYLKKNHAQGKMGIFNIKDRIDVCNTILPQYLKCIFFFIVIKQSHSLGKRV